MTGRTLRRAPRALLAATVISAMAAGPAAALAPPDRGSSPSSATEASDRPGKKRSPKAVFPSWSRKAAEAREALVARRSERVPAREASEAVDRGNGEAASRSTGASAKAAPPSGPTKDAIKWSDGHAGGREMALAMTAAGIPFGTTVDRADIVRAGHEFGVVFGPRIDSGEIDRVRDGAWELGGARMTAAGLDYEGKLDPHDVAVRAAELGIEVGTQVDPGDIVAVLAAGQQGLGEMLRAAGFPFGNVVNTSDLRTAARIYGVRVGKSMRGADARTIAEAAVTKGDPHRTLQYARIGKVDFHLPGRRPEYIGFHQASDGRVLPQRRWGTPLSEFLPSRSRGTHRAGAVDITMPPGDTVYAPVSGTVVETKRYALYGKYTDERLRIVPDDDPRMLTTVLHVQNLRVRPGDRIVAGETVIADSVRKFPFWSQIDGWSGRPWGHVHIETRWR